jgi:hypothetical protein
VLPFLDLIARKLNITALFGVKIEICRWHNEAAVNPQGERDPTAITVLRNEG